MEKREKKKAGVPSYEQSSTNTTKKERGDPEYSIQENPKKQRKKGGGKGKGGGLSSRTKQVRFHDSLDGSSLAHAIQVSMGPLLETKQNNSTESL